MVAALISFLINMSLVFYPTQTSDVPTQQRSASQIQTMGTAEGGTSTWSEATD